MTLGSESRDHSAIGLLTHLQEILITIQERSNWRVLFLLYKTPCDHKEHDLYVPICTSNSNVLERWNPATFMASVSSEKQHHPEKSLDVSSNSYVDPSEMVGNWMLLAAACSPRQKQKKITEVKRLFFKLPDSNFALLGFNFEDKPKSDNSNSIGPITCAILSYMTKDTLRQIENYNLNMLRTAKSDLSVVNWALEMLTNSRGIPPYHPFPYVNVFTSETSNVPQEIPLYPNTMSISARVYNKIGPYQKNEEAFPWIPEMRQKSSHERVFIDDLKSRNIANSTQTGDEAETDFVNLMVDKTVDVCCNVSYITRRQNTDRFDYWIRLNVLREESASVFNSLKNYTPYAASNHLEAFSRTLEFIEKQGRSVGGNIVTSTMWVTLEGGRIGSWYIGSSPGKATISVSKDIIQKIHTKCSKMICLHAVPKHVEEYQVNTIKKWMEVAVTQIDGFDPIRKLSNELADASYIFQSNAIFPEVPKRQHSYDEKIKYLRESESIQNKIKYFNDARRSLDLIYQALGLALPSDFSNANNFSDDHIRFIVETTKGFSKGTLSLALLRSIVHRKIKTTAIAAVGLHFEYGCFTIAEADHGNDTAGILLWTLVKLNQDPLKPWIASEKDEIYLDQYHQRKYRLTLRSALGSKDSPQSASNLLKRIGELQGVESNSLPSNTSQHIRRLQALQCMESCSIGYDVQKKESTITLIFNLIPHSDLF